MHTWFLRNLGSICKIQCTVNDMYIKLKGETVVGRTHVACTTRRGKESNTVAYTVQLIDLTPLRVLYLNVLGFLMGVR